jgi:DNA-directed RNA polymerase alpha subunit
VILAVLAMRPGMAPRFSLDEGATLNMELMVDIGKGYQPAAANRPADAPIGLIPVDALYSDYGDSLLKGLR